MKMLRFIGVDNWDRPVYQDESGRIWKDVNLGHVEPALHNASDNDFYGEPDMPIWGEYEIMKAARVYMFYAYIHFACKPKAPHAYLPVLLNDKNEDERVLALLFGKQLLNNCDKLIVCGNKLSEGMYGEIKSAVRNKMPVQVFSQAVNDILQERFKRDGIDSALIQYENGNLHFALSWGADELAPYWEEA